MATRSLNKVMLIGNIARDPELRYTPSGTAVCSFRIATNRSWQPSDGGERKEETEFHRIVTWNKLAELCSQLITKGRKVYIEGRLQTRQWETPEGERRSTTEIVAEDMVLLDSRRVAEESGSEVRETRGTPVEELTEEKKKEPKKEEDKEEKDKKEEKKSADDEKDKKDKKEKDKDKDGKKEETKEDEGDIDIDDIPF